jgi:hypothetical protein
MTATSSEEAKGHTTAHTDVPPPETSFISRWQLWIALGVVLASAIYAYDPDMLILRRIGASTEHDVNQKQPKNEPVAVSVDPSIAVLLRGWHEKGFSVPIKPIPNFGWDPNDQAFPKELRRWGNPVLFRDAPVSNWVAVRGLEGNGAKGGSGGVGPGKWTADFLRERVGQFDGVRVKKRPDFLYYSRSSHLYPDDPQRERAPPSQWQVLNERS